METTFDKGQKFTISKDVKLRYVYRKSSGHVAYATTGKIPVVAIPEDITITYKIHITFVKIGDGRYCVAKYTCEGLSPWRYLDGGSNKEYRLCTSAVNLQKVATNEDEVEKAVNQLVIAAESCCEPDLICNNKGHIVNMTDEENLKIQKICEMVEKHPTIDIDWLTAQAAPVIK